MSALDAGQIQAEMSPGRVYTLDYVVVPGMSNWLPVVGQEMFPGSNGLHTLNDPGVSTSRVYRVRVSIP